MKRRHYRWLAVVAVGATLVAACGSDNSSSSSGATAKAAAATTAAAASTTASPAGTAGATTTVAGASAAAVTNPPEKPATGTPIKMFSITSASTAKDVAAGLQLGVKDLNAHGGINGHPVDLTICDDKTDPNVAAQCARDAIAAGAIAEVDRQTSYGATVNPIEQAAGIPVLGGGLFSQADFGATNLYAINAGVLSTIGSAVAAVKLNYKKIGVPYIDVPAGASLAPTIKPLVEPLGGSVVGVIPIPATVADVTPMVAAEIQANPDIIVDGLVLNTYAKFIQGTRQQGSDVPFMVSSGLGDAAQLTDAIGSGVKNVFVDSQSDFTSQGYQQFLAAYKAYSDYKYAGEQLIWAWESFQLVKKVGEAATDNTPKAYTDSVSKLTNFSVGNLTPALDFSKPGNALGGKAPALRNDTLYFSTLQGGKFVPLGNGQPIATLGA